MQSSDHVVPVGCNRDVKSSRRRVIVTHCHPVKIFGITFDDQRRWALFLPPLLLIAFLAGLFVLAFEGQSRLESANLLVQQSDQRRQSLSDLQNLLLAAESARRGYLITGQKQDLAPTEMLEERAGTILGRIGESYRGDATATGLLRQLRLATGKKMGELGASIALAERQGSVAAMQLMRTGEGARFLEEIRNIIATLMSREQATRTAAAARWKSDLILARWISGAGALFNILLVLLAMRLVMSDMRRRSQQAADLNSQNQRLEDQVTARTRDLVALSIHLQEVSEQEKRTLSRELHDELGGLLVSARMDASWLERKLAIEDPAVRQRFKRIQDSLAAGVDLKRRVIEGLRPTLLDNMGLIAALRWQVKESCSRASLRCTERYPEQELALSPQAAIAIFRTVQEALNNIVKHAGASHVDIAVEVIGTDLLIQIADDGRGLTPEQLKTLGSHGLAAMRHRIEALGGWFGIANPGAGGVVIRARIPLERILDRTQTHDA